MEEKCTILSTFGQYSTFPSILPAEAIYFQHGYPLLISR